MKRHNSLALNLHITLALQTSHSADKFSLLRLTWSIFFSLLTINNRRHSGSFPLKRPHQRLNCVIQWTMATMFCPQRGVAWVSQDSWALVFMYGEQPMHWDWMRQKESLDIPCLYRVLLTPDTMSLDRKIIPVQRGFVNLSGTLGGQLIRGWSRSCTYRLLTSWLH